MFSLHGLLYVTDVPTYAAFGEPPGAVRSFRGSFHGCVPAVVRHTATRYARARCMPAVGTLSAFPPFSLR